MTRRATDRLDSLGLAPRLLLNNLLVIVAGAGTVLVAALTIARPVFAGHLERAHLVVTDPTRQHITTAFDQAVFAALAVGIVTAAIAAAAISWLVARRLARPVQEVADATRRLAEGNLDVHVPDPHMGPEFATLSSSVNTLAEHLASTESSRRQLTADLAHQLRTPIASMEATITAVQDGVLPVDTTTLDTLTEQSERLRRLVSDLEVVSRAQERQLLLNPEPVRVDTLIKTAVDAQRERFRAADITLNTTIETDPMRVRADADRLQEVLANLLDNALRHTPPGGTVSIAAARQDSTTGHLAAITITDTGQGFRPEMAERIFHRFEGPLQHRLRTRPHHRPSHHRGPPRHTHCRQPRTGPRRRLHPRPAHRARLTPPSRCAVRARSAGRDDGPDARGAVPADVAARPHDTSAHVGLMIDVGRADDTDSTPERFAAMLAAAIAVAELNEQVNRAG